VWLDLRNLGYLMPSWLPRGSHLIGLLRQLAPAVLAFSWQEHFPDVHLGRGNQRAMVPRVSELAAGFALAFVLAAARSLLPGQTIGGRGLGRIGGVALAQRELSL